MHGMCTLLLGIHCPTSQYCWYKYPLYPNSKHIVMPILIRLFRPMDLFDLHSMVYPTVMLTYWQKYQNKQVYWSMEKTVNC
jgi:hypothetical protein